MRPRRVLVTGASGLLGCRLVERLALGEGVRVRALAHRPGRAVRLARLPVEIVCADIADRQHCEAAVSGCDVVVHCAYSASGDRQRDRAVTVSGTRYIAEAAREAGVSRFIHISTVAVYSYAPPPQVDEASPPVRCGEPYCDNKIDAEAAVWSLVRRYALPAVVLRLGHIYGPFSNPWTVRPLRHLQEGYVTLVDGGDHVANAVFVDNAVEAIIRSIRSEAALGEAFFVTDDPVSWRVWFGRYASWLGVRPATIDGHAALSPTVGQQLGALACDIRALLPPVLACLAQQIKRSPTLWPVISRLRQWVPQEIRMRATGAIRAAAPVSSSLAPKLPSLDLLRIYASRTVFAADKAKRLLGYGPAIGFEQAMDVTERWARWARLIP